jgi:eukaryotic-like serine/threonine-protein kinase
VHRDIKPSNVVYINGIAKLADVGLVAQVDTTDLSLVGTRDFMDPLLPSTPAGDLYGLGKVLYVAMTGLGPGRFP